MIEFRIWYTQRNRRPPDRPHQRPGDRRRHAAVPGRHAALLRPAEDQVAARRARGGRTSTPRSAARGATKSARAPRSASSRCATPRASGIPKHQRPELWNLLNGRIRPGESIRVFPLSNWTEIDVWQYIHVENIPIVPLYFAKEREVVVRGNSLLMLEQPFVPLLPGERPPTGEVPDALARLLAVHRRRAIGRRHGAEDHRGAGRDAAIPSASSGSSTTIRTGRWS